MNIYENRQVSERASLIYRIVSLRVVDQPGMACIEVLKDRDSGKLGIHIVPHSYITDVTVIK